MAPPNPIALLPRHYIPSDPTSYFYTSTSSSSSLEVDHLITPPAIFADTSSLSHAASNSKITSSSNPMQYALSEYLDAPTRPEFRGIVSEQDRKVKLRRMGLERAATWTAEVGIIGRMEYISESAQVDENEDQGPGQASQGKVCDEVKSTPQAFKPQRPTLSHRSRSHSSSSSKSIILSDATRQDPPSSSYQGFPHPYRMAPVRPALSRSFSANSTKAERATSGLGLGMVQGGKRRARTSIGEVLKGGGSEGVRPIRASGWVMTRSSAAGSGTGKQCYLPRKTKSLDVAVPQKHHPAAQIIKPREPLHSCLTSRDLQTSLVLEDVDMETLWREGKCSGRGGKVRCGVDGEAYWVEMDGLVASPYSTSLYLCGGRCLKIDAEQALGSHEFHETIDFPEMAQMEKMHAKWLPQGKLVVLVPRKSEDDEQESTSSPTRSSPSQQQPLVGAPRRPGLLGESSQRVASGGDVPRYASRRRGTVRLEDIEAE